MEGKWQFQFRHDDTCWSSLKLLMTWDTVRQFSNFSSKLANFTSKLAFGGDTRSLELEEDDEDAEDEDRFLFALPASHAHHWVQSRSRGRKPWLVHLELAPDDSKLKFFPCRVWPWGRGGLGNDRHQLDASMPSLNGNLACYLDASNDRCKQSSAKDQLIRLQKRMTCSTSKWLEWPTVLRVLPSVPKPSLWTWLWLHTRVLDENLDDRWPWAKVMVRLQGQLPATIPMPERTRT